GAAVRARAGGAGQSDEDTASRDEAESRRASVRVPCGRPAHRSRGLTMAKTIERSIPKKAEWPRTRVDAMDREQQAHSARFDKSVGVKDVKADEATLRLACTRVPTPRALRGSR